MANNKRQVFNSKTFINLAVLSLIYACYWWVRHHSYPHFDDWAEVLVVWVVLDTVRNAYRRIVEELEQQNALLITIAMFLENQTPVS